MQKADVFYKRTEINRNVFGYKNFIYSLDNWKKCKNWRYKFRKENQ